MNDNIDSLNLFIVMKHKKLILSILAPFFLAFFLILLLFKYYSDYNLINKRLNGIQLYFEILNISNNEKTEENIKLLKSTIQNYSSKLDLENYINKNFTNQSEWVELISYVYRSSNLFYDPNPDANLLQNIIYHFLILNYNFKQFKELNEIIKFTIEQNRKFIEDKNILKAIDDVNLLLISIDREYQEDSIDLKSIENIKEQVSKLIILLKNEHLQKEMQETHTIYIFLISLILLVLILYRWNYKINLKEMIEINNRSTDETQELNHLIHNIEQNIHQIIKWNFTAIKAIESYHYKKKELYNLQFTFYKQIIYLNIIFLKLRFIIKHNVNTLIDVQDIVKLSRDSFQDYTSSFEEMSSAIQQISSSIQNGLNESIKTKQNFQSQNELLEKDFKEISMLLEEFKDMKKILQNLFSQMRLFKDKSSEIFKILSTIQDITDRTNLLALNASIEAARAGEHGKGFSVVAEEITKLAEKIKQSTKSVQNIIMDYQENVKSLSDKGSNVSIQMDRFFDIFIQKQNSIKKISMFYNDFNDFFNIIINEHKEVVTAISELEKVNEKNFNQFDELSKRFEHLESIMVVTDILADDMINLWHKFQLVESLDFSRDFSVKIPLMDEHHSRLFEIFNDLLNIYKDVKNWESKTNEIVKELIDYTIYHFGAEEAIMKKYNYPDYEEHKKAHDKFIDYIKKQTFIDLNSVFDFTIFLFDWLVSHIYIIDKQYSEYFENMGLLEQIEEEERKLLVKK